MPGPTDPLPHIVIPDRYSETRDYTYAMEVRGGSVRKLAPRVAATHGAKLQRDLAALSGRIAALKQHRAAAGVSDEQGVVVQFDGEPGFELAVDSLERSRSGIRLLAVKERDTVVEAMVHVPDGKLHEFERLVEQYRTELTKRGAPKNNRLVANVAAIRLAVLESLWTDQGELPDSGDTIWWEVWLRHTDTALDEFQELARAQNIAVGQRHLEFVDRVVVLAYADVDQLRASVALIDTIAELRRAKDLASFFMGMGAEEQAGWIDDVLDGAPEVEVDAVAVCLLDTGVNRGHPLLAPYLDEDDMHAVDAGWGVADHAGHGTEMAGLAAWGDLSPVLAGDWVEPPRHRLESVVLLPPGWAPGTPPDLYGAYTASAVAIPEIVAYDRRRVFCMTVATEDDRDRGRPSSWSAEVDTLCHGGRDDNPRLMVLAAGNVWPETSWVEYPNINDTEQIHDPGQAWNALTVGAMTDKAWFDPATYPDWTLIAGPGALSPSSTTSLDWNDRWPNKPDLVLEGGNANRSPSGDVDLPADLRLLSTSAQMPFRLLESTGDTSGAAALVARMAAGVMTTYPEFWPETVRALLIHSARWTEGMQRSLPSGLSYKRQQRTLVRRYGWGQPSLARAIYSAQNVLTLVAQRELQPFHNTADLGRAPSIKTKDWHLFKLPWPTDVLLELAETQVELRVTLSFFVEPNPARRGWKSRHRYQSCALRFAMQKPTEGLDDFRARVSKDEQDEERGLPSFDEPGWLLGTTIRNRGSVLSDVWQGNAADLAAREHIAVHPVGGWWKERPKLGNWDQTVRYALVISILAPGEDVDVYSPVAVEVGVPVEVMT